MLRLPRATPADSAPLRPVIVPGSKSASNRALLLAASARGPSRLAGVLDADDTRAMAEALRGCGAALDLGHGPLGLTRGPLEGARCGSKGYATCVLPAPRPLRVPDGDQLDVGASGTTLRFLLPWLAFHATGPVRIVGAPRLFERPLGPLVEVLLDLGAQWLPSSSGSRHTAGGVLHPISFPPERLDLTIDGAVSSQFASGLLLAAAVLPEASMLRVTNPTSASYLELTVRWLTRFGRDVAVETTSGPTPTWTARMAPGTLFGLDTCVPGDWSAAAAPLAAAAVTGRRVHVGPLDPDDGQGDAAILDILEAAGARVARPTPGSPDVVSVEGPLERGFEADLSTCPDLGPVLAAAAAVAPGPSVLTGVHTLPAKECDRLDASAVLVRWLGGEAEIVGGHTLRITPRPADAPVEARPPFSPRSDHRMAFAAAVGALIAGGDLLDPGCVSKTWPGFWEAWEGMLGEVSPRTPRP